MFEPMRMPEIVEATLDRYFAAIAARDADAWATNFAEDGRSEDPVGAAVVTGRRALKEFQQSIFDLFPVMRLDVVDRFVCGNGAAVRWRCHVESNGRSVDFDGINTYEVLPDGRIQGQKAFWDLLAVQQELSG